MSHWNCPLMALCGLHLSTDKMRKTACILRDCKSDRSIWQVRETSVVNYTCDAMSSQEVEQFLNRMRCTFSCYQSTRSIISAMIRFWDHLYKLRHFLRLYQLTCMASSTVLVNSAFQISDTTPAHLLAPNASSELGSFTFLAALRADMSANCMIGRPFVW